MTTKGAILKAIREHCLSCCNGSSKEVDICEVGNNSTSSTGRCELFPYRIGKDPRPSKTRGFQKIACTESEEKAKNTISTGVQ